MISGKSISYYKDRVLRNLEQPDREPYANLNYFLSAIFCDTKSDKQAMMLAIMELLMEGAVILVGRSEPRPAGLKAADWLVVQLAAATTLINVSKN
jgi:hypothetical protein